MRPSALRLVPITPAAAGAVLAGGYLPRGAVTWHDEYPLAETYDALGLIARTHEVLGWSGTTPPCWWMFQIVFGGQVVGDIGFHSPPAEGAGVVEIGYDVVPALRGQGIATRACGLILERAWRDGATEVVAGTDLDHAASQRVLTKAGFHARGPATYAISRPVGSGPGESGEAPGLGESGEAPGLGESGEAPGLGESKGVAP